MKTLYFDCFSGASGDMIVGALIDAGADFAEIRRGIESLGVPGFMVSAEKVTKRGLAATQFKVVQSDALQPHRHLEHVLEIIEAGDLPQPVKETAAATFRRLAECEAQVHGTTVEHVHFHEVGAIDSIADIVGTHLALHILGVKRVLASALPVGYGTVSCAHGVMPVPAPATALLLEGAAYFGGDVPGELVTPTGAALISQLAERYGPMPLMEIASVGCGSGTRDIADRANLLRVFLGETHDALAPTEPITVIETNIDDMNPELFPPLIAKLIEQGARDAFLTPILGKKGRPGYQVTVLCDGAKSSDLANVMFHESTTLGLRVRQEQRVCLDREWKHVSTAWGNVRIKLGRLDGRTIRTVPEFEDCRQIAERAHVPVLEVYQAAAAAAARGEVKND